MSSTRVDITLTIKVAQRYNVVSCRIVEGLSELTNARFERASFRDSDVRQVLGAVVGIVEHDHVVGLPLGGRQVARQHGL